MSETMRVVQTLDDRDVVAALGRQIALMDKIERRIEQQSKKSGETMSKWSGSIANLIAGYTSFSTLLSTVREAQQAIITESDVLADRYDEIERRLRVQSGLTDLGTAAASDNIYSIAYETATTADAAQASATQLVSSGFTTGEASGDSLRELLRVIAASNLTRPGDDPASIAQAISGYLASQGLAKTGSNVADVGQRVQVLFKGTNLQLSDLSEFAKQADAFKGKLTSQEQLGSLSALRDSMPAAEATTSLRNIVAALTSQKLQPEKMEVLKQLGIDPNDIDLQGRGENILQAVTRFSRGLQTVAPEMRDSFTSKFFEKANVATFNALLERRGQIANNIALQSDRSGFEADVTAATTGRMPGRRRLELERELRVRSESRNDESIAMAVEQEWAERGFDARNQWLGRKFYEGGRLLGFSPETAAAFATNQWDSEPVRNRVAAAERPSADRSLRLPPAKTVAGVEISPQTNRAVQSAIDSGGLSALAAALDRNTTEQRRANNRPGRPPAANLSRPGGR